MNRLTFRRTSARGALVLFAALLVPALASAQVWTGGGATDNWSDPANWEMGIVPTSGPGGSVTFAPTAAGRTTSRQDLADPFVTGTLSLQAHNGDFAITGNPIRLVDGTLSDTSAGNSRVVRAPIELQGPAVIQAAGASAFRAGLTLLEVGGTGPLTVNSGLLRIGHATYTGTTTVTNGELQIGGWTSNVPFREFIIGSTEGQGDYLVRPGPGSFGSVLSGIGTIGLAPGKKITVEGGGLLFPSYFALGPTVSSIAVNGDVRFGDRGEYSIWADRPGYSTFLDVNGVLDLTGVGDVLNVYGFPSISSGQPMVGSTVIAEYESRLGEFDVIRPALAGDREGRSVIVSYTSAAGDGPGQVIVTVVPEPAATCLVAAAAGLGLLARRRPRRE